jgi:hypothetical protein
VPGKLNLYNLGDLGVHLVETPVHSPDGSFTSAQNASVSQNQGQHGIRSRHGLAKLTDSALNGAVLAIGNMPFQDPFEGVPTESSGAIYYNNLAEGSNFSGKSTTGAVSSWAASSDIGRWPDLSYEIKTDHNVFSRGGAISTNGVLYYYAREESPFGGLTSWNGSASTTLATYTVGANEVFRGLCRYEGEFYLLIANTSANTAQIYQLVGSSFVSLAATISHEATCMTPALGKLWVGTDTNRIYSYELSTGTSTTEVTVTPNASSRVAITDIAHFNGVLYASGGTANGVATAATEDMVLKRASDGTWSDITPAASGNYGPLCVFDDLLFVARSSHGAFAGCSIYRYDGSTFTVDLDATSLVTSADYVQSMIAWNAHLYANVEGTNNTIIRRTTGDVWSLVVDQSGASSDSPTGGLGFY